MAEGKHPKGARRLFRLCAQLALGSSVWGYNIGILSSVLVHSGWRAALGNPSPAQTGLVTGAYYLGALLAYLCVAHPLADALGRRSAAGAGTAALSAGALAMASAGSLGAMMSGRVMCGLGAGVVSTTVPLYQSEMAPAKERGKYVTINHIGFVAGLATGLWAGYLITFWKGDAGEYWGWRVLILMQLLPALAFAAMLPLMPETPRWLLQSGDADSASKVLHWLREDVHEPSAVAHELDAINADIQLHHRQASSSFPAKTLALFRRPALFARLWRAFLLQFMASMCGAAAMKYYLPTLLRALGLGTRPALMAGAVEATTKIGMGVVEMWLIDRVGRKTCLAGGSVIMAVAMLVNGVLPQLFPKNVSRVADTVCIAFIFLYAFGFSLGLGPTAWLYSSEIFPTTYRARGLNFAASGGSIGSIIVAQIWPVGVAKFGSGVYLFFFAVNAICVPVIWLLYPETKGCALEDMDALFGKETRADGMGLRGLQDQDEEREPQDGDSADSEAGEAQPLLSG
ncbi:ascus development protein [Cordyceps fumosorosea ARSEF 2679]|uniref:Ascus development protein n=1 Tax=Cordyceps fumosorosea (strain ARSEF 2679) TaxID=1081104 RepID=A0A162I6J4_CORFA|nr:ascus development protein [Cordyceps fumosorosea ARSEF 2679]OAA52965.1 ascus development protein [Cordyceps fumosorosea ARSEF 2679]